MFKLAFFDLDGTLLDSSGAISRRTRAAVDSLVARGVHVVLASGRPPRMVRRLQRDLGLAGPAICYNGALVSADAGGGTLWERRIAPDDARAVLDLVRRAGVGNILCEAGDCLTGEVDDDLLTLARREGWGLREDRALTGAFSTGAHKLLAICPPGRHPALSARLLSALPGRIDLITSVPGTPWLEILPAGAGKAVAAREVSLSLGHELTEAVAFGDGENDAELLARAGLGVAMANGDPRAKAVARRMAPPNDEDGLAQVVEELLAVG